MQIVTAGDQLYLKWYQAQQKCKIIQYVTKNPCTVVIARPVILRPQSGAIFTSKVK